MFDQPYEFSQRTKKKIIEGTLSYEEYLFTFTCCHNHRYIVVVEEYDYFVYVIKYYLKNHRLSKNRFSFKTNTNDASRKMMTCINIMKLFYNKNHFASFGFIGANMIGEPLNDTKRFKFYKKIMSTFFAPIDFQHLQRVDKSAYPLLNRHNTTEKIKDKIAEMFQNHYSIEFS